MRYAEILSEAIPNRLRNLPLFVKKRNTELAALLAQITEAGEAAKANASGLRMLRSWLSYGSGDHDVASDLYRLLGTVERPYGLIRTVEDIVRSLDSVVHHGPTFLRYVTDAMARIDPVDPAQEAVVALLPTAEKGAEDYGYAPGDPENERDDEYREAMALLDALRRYVEAEKQIRTILARMASALNWRDGFDIGADKMRPKHAETETLWHATAFATEIARDGFSAEKPDARKGVGNFGSQATISFTHDYKIAHDIARSLKEIWMIVHGQLTARQIVGWIAAEKLDAAKIEQSVGLSVKEPSDNPLFPTRTRLKRLSEIRDIEDTIKLYNIYLWFTKIRTNPVFTNVAGLADTMKDRAIKDIGILKCEVRLTPQDEYLPGEAEFRVSADRVVSIERIG